MSALDRRDFIRRAAALSGGALFAPSLGGLTMWSDPAAGSLLRRHDNGGYGDLIQSVDCPELWIPEGFRVVRLSQSRTPSAANASFIVPNAMDGMTAFPLPNGNIRLIRNHEMVNPAARPEPLGRRPYDRLASGGTTTLDVAFSGSGADREAKVVAEFVSLGGTHVNCAGGQTPWGSWLTCEETTNGLTHGFEKRHGYIFEVPADATEEVEAVPLVDMGRFVHEAIAVDPNTGIVYETEDVRWVPENAVALPGSGFYRFIPNTPQRLAEGGQLQILGVRGRPRYSTVVGQRVGVPIRVEWIDVADPDPVVAETDPSAIFRRGYRSGAALFQRLEGCFWADDSCYFVSTSGGDARAGQVWRYIPDGDGGSITLVFESPGRDVLDAPDNICVSNRGGIIICEDGSSDQFVRGLTPDGVMVDLVKQPDVDEDLNPTEFAGCCFTPDSEVLFFNVQGSTRSWLERQGSTFALWGPWNRGAL
jgi:secreted PhoX family phosphatase